VSRLGSSVTIRERTEGSGETRSDKLNREKAIKMMMVTTTAIVIITAVLITGLFSDLKPAKIFNKRK